MLIENLNENSLIALCTVYDSVKINLKNVAMCQIVKNRYHLSIKERKKKDEASKKLENE